MGFFDKLFAKAAPKAPEAIVAEEAEGIVCSPVAGTPIPLSEVADPLFSKEVMGKGCGVKPTEGVAYAPVTGEVTAAFPTGHAYGILGDDGVEVLVHVGMDTVNMGGKGFTKIAEQGAKIKAGEPLGTFSSADIKAAGYDDTVIVVITNTDEYADVALIADGALAAGGALIKVTK